MIFTLAIITVKVAASFLYRTDPIFNFSLCFVGGLIDGLLTASVDFLYSTLKAVRDQLIQNTRRLLLKAMKISAKLLL